MQIITEIGFQSLFESRFETKFLLLAVGDGEKRGEAEIGPNWNLNIIHATTEAGQTKQDKKPSKSGGPPTKKDEEDSKNSRPSWLVKNFKLNFCIFKLTRQMKEQSQPKIFFAGNIYSCWKKIGFHWTMTGFWLLN